MGDILARTAIKCLSCATAARPRDCEFVQECGPHEKCSVQSILTTAGYTMYSVGCTDIHKCTSFVGKRAILNATDLQEIQRQNEFGAIPDEQWDQGTKNVILCAECCDTELCNVKGCGEEGLPAGSGPVCYGCDQQRDPYNCNQIVLCGLDEECHLSSKMIGIDKVYQSGCFKRTACQLLEHPGDNVLVGRRQRVVDMLTIKKRASFCNKCCTGNLCNFGNCSSLVYQTNTLTPMTYPATTQAVLTPVNGGWNAWSSWNLCSVTCGQGSHDRFRVCNNPHPANGGATCSGPSTETQLCTQQMCAVDGQWSLWTTWSICSKTCGTGGTRFRQRTCDNPPPSVGGKDCAQSPYQSQDCDGLVGKQTLKCSLNILKFNKTEWDQ
ncbi:hypothetical protein ACJMK2_026608 [Sinanodonta woodiana]|uniref:Uncharacterized protein n=1 Tax=Sinanodonta woodiana TaxID=1069815 RepID=A0ABD3XNK3_SINWO